MGFAPKSCAVVEGSIVGIEAASRAGMQAFLYSPFNQSELNAKNAISFKDMCNLPDLIASY